MGEVELLPEKNVLVIHAVIIIYGDAASDALSLQVAGDIEKAWNEPREKYGSPVAGSPKKITIYVLA